MVSSRRVRRSDPMPVAMMTALAAVEADMVTTPAAEGTATTRDGMKLLEVLQYVSYY